MMATSGIAIPCGYKPDPEKGCVLAPCRADTLGAGLTALETRMVIVYAPVIVVVLICLCCIAAWQVIERGQRGDR